MPSNTLNLAGRVQRLRLFFEEISKTGDFSKNAPLEDRTAELRKPRELAPDRLWIEDSEAFLEKGTVKTGSMSVSVTHGKADIGPSMAGFVIQEDAKVDEIVKPGMDRQSSQPAMIMSNNAALKHTKIVSTDMSSEMTVHVQSPTAKLQVSHNFSSSTPLFTATVTTPFEASIAQEISANQGESIDVYEVLPNGWCLARIGNRVGWIPQSYLQIIEGGTGIDESLLLALPSQQERELLLKFLQTSKLFSEALLTSKVVVYTDIIDQLIRIGGSTACAMAALSELDSQKKKFNTMEDLPGAVESVVKHWKESIASETQNLLNENADVLFVDKESVFSRADAFRLLSESTCGSDAALRLWQEIESKPNPCEDLDALTESLAKRHRIFLEKREKRLQAECEIVFEALRQPDVSLFERLLDLRANPIVQLLVNGLDSEMIVSRLKTFNKEGKRYQSLEDMMTAVFVAETQGDPSILCMGDGNVSALSGSTDDDDEEEAKLNAMEPSQRYQFMSKAVLAVLSDPSIVLFSALDCHVRISKESLRNLVMSAPSLRGLVCNIHILNAANTQLSTFEEIQDLQDSPLIRAEKKEVEAAIRRFFRNRLVVSDCDVEKFLNGSGAYGGRARTLLDEDVALAEQKPFDTLRSLAEAVKRRCESIDALRDEDEQTLFQWLGHHAVFTTDVDIYDTHIEQMFRVAITGDRLVEALQHFEDSGCSYDRFEDLLNALIDYFEELKNEHAKHS